MLVCKMLGWRNRCNLAALYDRQASVGINAFSNHPINRLAKYCRTLGLYFYVSSSRPAKISTALSRTVVGGKVSIILYYYIALLSLDG